MPLSLQLSLLNFVLLASIRLRRLLHFLYVTGSHTHIFLPYLIRRIANTYLVLLESRGLNLDYKIIFSDNTRSVKHTIQVQYKQYKFVWAPKATVLSIMLQPVQPASKGSLTRGGVRYSRRLGQRRSRTVRAASCVPPSRACLPASRSRHSYTKHSTLDSRLRDY